MSGGTAVGAPAANGWDAHATRYESLRAGVIAGSSRGTPPYTKLLREGMRAWLFAPDPTPPPQPPPRPVPAEQRQLCALLTDLVLAHGTEVRP